MRKHVDRINRNIVECKATWSTGYLRRIWSINRNIVECKEGQEFGYTIGSYGINRNIVECKVLNCRQRVDAFCVLIETSWNVKTVKADNISLGNVVLIETSWNVKRGATGTITWLIRINRNIVECKDQSRWCFLPECIRVLIETSWNVKDKPRLLAVPAFRINRNIVECKGNLLLQREAGTPPY